MLAVCGPLRETGSWLVGNERKEGNSGGYIGATPRIQLFIPCQPEVSIHSWKIHP